MIRYFVCCLLSMCRSFTFVFRVRDKAWAEEKKMGSFLSVTKGSSEPPKFVEIHYNGGQDGDAPLAFVGKGVTFDRQVVCVCML